jgi:cysteine-S-conjugate beta-lyase
MSKNDFDKFFDRTGTASVKWEATKQIYGADDLLPMWVADMDFKPPVEVIEAIKKRADHAIFGYTFTPPSTAEAIQNWMKERHQWEIDTAWIEYAQGVVPAISTVIRALTEPGDNVLLTSPVYTPFFNMIEKNGRSVANAPLEIRDGRFEIQFDLFEEQLKQGVKLFLLCNPHNPGGRVWSREELLKIGELCLQYNCIILSDEIHSDLIFKPAVHVPIASLSKELQQNVITCIAPSKTFNIAGLKSSAMIIPNKVWMGKIKTLHMQQGTYSLNLFGIVAMEAAYRYGAEWLEELLNYISANMAAAKKFISENIPGISVMDPDGTYLLWLDCRKLGLSDKEINERLISKGKIALEPGAKYGPGGEGFLRMNLGCSKETLDEGLKRLKRAFE